MKFHRLFCAAAAVCAVALLLTACKKKPPVPGSPDPTAEEYSVQNKTNADAAAALSEIEELRDPEGTVRGVRSSEGFRQALQNPKYTQLRLTEEALGEVRIEAGDYTGRDIYLEAPDASVVSDADLGRLVISQVNAEGVTLNGTAETEYIKGGDVNLTLNNSVERLYITARDAHVTLNAGSFPVVYCDNTTDVITNKTEETVLLVFPTGAFTEIPSGKTYYMDTGELKNAK